MTQTPPGASRTSEVIAPGFGTREDLERLASDLSVDSEFPVAAVQAMMESRGRGIRSSRRGADAAAASQTTEPSTPISSAWADFMKEEGVGDTPGNNSKRGAPTSAKHEASQPSTGRKYKLEFDNDKKAKKESGLLVQSGTLEVSAVGRTKDFDWNAPYTLTTPTILLGVRVRSVFTACHACHSLAIAENGVVYGWGRNESSNLTGQLGKNVFSPTELPGLPKGKVISAGVGKHHTIVLLENDGLYAVGSNKVGQCGVNKGSEQLANFKKSTFANGLDPEIVMVRSNLFRCDYFLTASRSLVEKIFPLHSVLKGWFTRLDRQSSASWGMAKQGSISSQQTRLRLQTVTPSRNEQTSPMLKVKNFISTTRR